MTAHGAKASPLKKNGWRGQLKRKVSAQEITEWGGLGIIASVGKGRERHK